MARIAVVFHSGHGHTKVIAEAIVSGAQSVEGASTSLLEIKPDQIANGRWSDDSILEALRNADAIVFGCPTWMGSTSSVFKSFMETAFDVWRVQGWKDKLGGCFTNSASQSGDKLSTLIQLTVFGMQMGMLWVGVGDPPGNNWSGGSVDDVNRLGSWTGLMAQSNGDQPLDLAPTRGDRETANRYGQRIAKLALHWKWEKRYTTERYESR